MRKSTRLLKIAMVLLFFVFGSVCYGQQGTVSGTVLAEDDGTPLIGVTVKNLTTNKSTVTNSAGYYSIAAEKGHIISIMYVGYVPQKGTVEGNKIMNYKLVANSEALNDVIVTGYGQSKNKRELAYQAPVVTGEEIAQTKRSNFLNALAGRVPGLTVTSTSGLPGASAQIMLRGGTSIGGNNQPLFVVDGLPMTNGSIDQNDLVSASTVTGSAASLSLANRNSDYTNRISDINPDDIESVVILKGPEATAVYGSDGAAGAIVITTKKSTANGKTKITYSNSFALSEVYRYPQIQQVYSRGSNGASDATAYGTYGYSFFGPKYSDTTKFYDNMRNFFENAFTQQHNLSLEAGNKDLNYKFNAAYLNQAGVVPNTSLTRYNFRFTAFAQLNKRFKLNTTWSYTASDNNKAVKGGGSFYTNLMTYPTNIDARDYINSDGTRKILRNVALSAELNSPFWDVNKNKSNDKTYNFSGNVNLTANVITGLTATAIIGINQFSTLGTMSYHPYSRESFALGGYFSSYEQVFNGLNGTFRLNYRKTFNNKFSNDFYAGTYFEDNRSTLNAQRGERFYEYDFVSINNTDPISRLSTLSQTQIRKTRFYAGYTFGYNNLLYISLTGTREGTSTFSSSFQNTVPFFNYGSASASFILSDLGFMKSINKWVSYAKLRASFATTGKGPLAPYVIDNSFGSVVSTGGGFALGFTGSNYNLKPEFSKNFEVGGEFKFLKNRIGVDVAYFDNSIKDNIIAPRISYVSGALLQYMNTGSISSKGWEIQLTGSPVKSKKFTWDVTVNFDKARATVTSLPDYLPYYYDSDTWVFGSVRSQVGVGQSLGTLSGFTFQKNNNGELLIDPASGLPLQATTDYVPIADRQPEYKIGLINSFMFGDFSLSFNLDLRKGGDVFNANEMMMTINGISTRTLDRERPRVIKGVLKDGLENTATPTRNSTSITPYFRSAYYNATFAESDYIESVNWLRLRDVTIGYQLPDKLLKRQRVLKSASIFVTGTDLFMITNYSGMDPNVNVLNSSNTKGYGGAGIDYGAIPTPRALNLGIKLSF